MIIPIIMCGGSGTRLWPASRDDMPKQFMPMFGANSTFQDTLERLRAPDLFDKPIIVTNERFRFEVAKQAQSIDVPCDIVLEPQARDSAAAVAVAAICALERDPEAIALILAADHAVSKVDVFQKTCRSAHDAAKSGKIVTFGITPDHPATGYGYLQPGAKLGETSAHKLEAFVEKPDRETAEQYLAKGYLWNSGNFMFPAALMLQEIEAHAPEIAAAARGAVKNADRDHDFTRLSKAEFVLAPKISIDYAVMEKTKHAAVIPADIGWSDIGSWNAVWDLSKKDADGNAVSGAAVALETKNSIVRSPEGITTAVYGLDDIAVITTSDAVLVIPRTRSEHVKKLLAAVKDRQKPQDG